MSNTAQIVFFAMNDGKQFEFEVQELLRLMGLNASVTGYSQDGGVDLIAENPNPIFLGKYVVQCKAQKKPVGEPTLRDLFGTMHAAGANKGILITTSSFTSAARRFAEGKPIELIDGEKYYQLCEEYGLAPFDNDPTQGQATDELMEVGSNNVRILKFECTDPKEHREIQEFVFCVATLLINNANKEVVLTVSNTRITYNDCKIRVLERQANFGNGLDWAKILIEHEYVSYYLTVEGQPAAIEAFAPLIPKKSPNPSGCLLLLILQVVFVLTCITVFIHFI